MIIRIKTYHLLFIIFTSIMIYILYIFPIYSNLYAYDENSLRIQNIDVSSRFPTMTMQFDIHPSLITHEFVTHNDSITLYEDSTPVKNAVFKGIKTQKGRLILLIDTRVFNNTSDMKLVHATKKLLFRLLDYFTVTVAVMNSQINEPLQFTNSKKSLKNTLNNLYRCQGLKINNSIIEQSLLYYAKSLSHNDILLILPSKHFTINDTFNNQYTKSNSTIQGRIYAIKNTKAHTLSHFIYPTWGCLINVNNTRLTTLLLLGNINRIAISWPTSLPPDGKIHRITLQFKNNKKKYSVVKDIIVAKKTFIPDIKFMNVIIIIASLLLAIIIGILIFLVCELIKLKKRISEITSNSSFSHNTQICQDSMKIASTQIPDSLIVPRTPAKLIIKEDLKQGTEVILNTSETIIGSSESSSVHLNDITVSASHAKILFLEDGYHLFDLISESGTYLNGKKLIRPKILYDWDEIQIGKYALIFRTANTALNE